MLPKRRLRPFRVCGVPTRSASGLARMRRGGEVAQSFAPSETLRLFVDAELKN